MSNWITPYSTYTISKFGGAKIKKQCVCGKVYHTNVDRMQCSKECRKKRLKHYK